MANQKSGKGSGEVPMSPGLTGGSSIQYLASSIQNMPVRTIAITSGKGGVGKTNIAANLGLVMAAQNKRVCIIDADLGLANIDVILKLKPKYNIEHVIAGAKKLKEIFIRGPAGLTIIPAGSGRLSLANLSDLDRDRLIRELVQSTSDFDIMFIDTAAGISHNVTLCPGRTGGDRYHDTGTHSHYGCLCDDKSYLAAKEDTRHKAQDARPKTGKRHLQS